MGLTPEEQAELDQLNTRFGNGLSPEEQAELDQLNTRFGAPTAPTTDQETITVPPKAPMSDDEVSYRGISQTIPAADEVKGLLGASAEQITNALGTSGQAVERYTSTGDIPGRLGAVEQPQARSFGDAYRANRDEHQAQDDAAAEQDPGRFYGSQLAASTIASSTPQGMVGLGGLQGFFGSRADLTKGDFDGVMEDTAKGMAVGGIAPAVGALAKTGLAQKVGSAIGNNKFVKAFRGGDDVAKYGEDGVRKDLANEVTGALDEGDTAATLAQANARRAFSSQYGSTPVDTPSVAVKAREMLERYGAARTSDGYGPISLKEMDELAGYTKALSQPRTADDAYRIWDDLNTKIIEMEGKPKTEFQAQLSMLRGGIKDKLHKLDPDGLAVADAKHAKRMDESKLIRGAKNEARNESFVANLGGRNKGNAQDAFKEAMSSRPDLLQKVEDQATWKSFEGTGGMGSGHGIRNTILPTVLGTVGHAVAGPIGMAAGIATGGAISHPPMQRALLTSAGSLASKIPSMPDKYKHVLSEASKRGGNALAITHFILGNRDPEYQSTLKDDEE